MAVWERRGGSRGVTAGRRRGFWAFAARFGGGVADGQAGPGTAGRGAGRADYRGHRGQRGVTVARTTSRASTNQFGEVGVQDKNKIKGI